MASQWQPYPLPDMQYIVKTNFNDMEDNLQPYSVGDAFPREGLEVSQERLDYLASDKNRLGVPVIEKVKPKRRTK